MELFVWVLFLHKTVKKTIQNRHLFPYITGESKMAEAWHGLWLRLAAAFPISFFWCLIICEPLSSYVSAVFSAGRLIDKPASVVLGTYKWVESVFLDLFDRRSQGWTFTDPYGAIHVIHFTVFRPVAWPIADNPQWPGSFACLWSHTTSGRLVGVQKLGWEGRLVHRILGTEQDY